MKIERRFTVAGQDAYADINFRRATSEIRNPDGSLVFQLKDIEVPEAFSQVAADIIAQKYFRKAGVAARLRNFLLQDSLVKIQIWEEEKSKIWDAK